MTAHVYRLVICYPEGSQRPGWRPACWSDPETRARMPRKVRRAIDKTVFRWPRERMFLSSSSAYERAWLLRFYGADVTVERSCAVTWPEYLPPDAMDGWLIHDEIWPEFDASGIPYEKALTGRR